VLVFLSRKSCSKIGYVQKEMKYALEQRDLRPKGYRYIIPILVEECEPPREFRRIQWSRMWEDSWYEKLKLALEGDF
jgi:TIR domain